MNNIFMQTSEMIPIIKKFFEDTDVEKVFMFGSRSKFQEKAESDIDLLVYFPATTNLLKISKYKGLLEQKLGLAVDLLTPESISIRILPLIQKDQKLIYERKG